MGGKGTIRFCPRCLDIQLREDGVCLVCAQQVLFPFTVYDYARHVHVPAPGPLSIIRRSGHKKTGNRGIRVKGRFHTCAVVSEDDRDYLTACGDLVRVGSVSLASTTSCGAYRRILRAAAAEEFRGR